MKRILTVVGKELREALPATVFFLVLFHLIALTKAVLLQEYDITALRAVGATVGALLVAKAILLVEALPIARLSCGPRIQQILWKTLLYGAVVVAFRFVEELVPIAVKHGSLTTGIAALYREISWPTFAVMTLWIFGGLFLYCLAQELVRVLGWEKVKTVLFGARSQIEASEQNR